MRPVVVGLLLWTAYDMAVTVFGANKQGWGAVLAVGWDKVLIVMVVFALLTCSKINPAFIILAGATLGGVLYR